MVVASCVPVEDSAFRQLGCPRTPVKRKLSSASTRTSSSHALICSDVPLTLLSHIPMEASGYSRCLWRDIVYWCIGTLTLGISILICSWFKVVALKLRCRKSSIDRSSLILLKTMNGKEIPLPLFSRRVRLGDLRLTMSPSEGKKIDNESGDEVLNVLGFEFNCQQFIFNPWEEKFVNVEFNIENLLFSEIWGIHGKGLTDSNTITSRRQLFGKCEVHVPLKSSFELVVTECLHPFYVFQICSLVLWFADNYYFYATAVLLLSSFSLLISIRETIKNNRNLHEMAKFSCLVNVLRTQPSLPLRLLGPRQAKECLQPQNSTELVPGDIFSLERGIKLPCDAILLVGSALVDESMMTGESKPVYKTSLPTGDVPSRQDPSFNFQKHSKHVLYGGSEIRDAGHLGGPALCLVAKTGFSTEQGRMMRSLVHPVASTRMNFEKETWKFVGLLACMSCFTFGLTLYQGIMNGLHPFTIFKRSIDTVTIAVPPALPIIVSVGIICAQDALKKRSGTRCLMPSRINVAGRTNVLVFDKTGTLTEDDEDLLAVVASSTQIQPNKPSLENVHHSLLTRFPKGVPLRTNADPPVHNDSSLPHLALPTASPESLSVDFVAGLATCHSLGFVEGELIGDPLEYQMFNFTGWRLYPPRLQREETEDSLELNESDDLDMYMSVSPDEDISIGDSRNGEPCGSELDHPPTSPTFVILRVFEFDPHLQRMSVIVQNRTTGETKAYCKGSPERVFQRCSSDSIPYDSEEVLSGHTEQGLRVLAISQKPLDCSLSPSMIQRLKREDVEEDMTFLGLLLFTNLLRPDSAGAIAELRAAGCCVYMATGDGPVTGAAIGFQAGLLPLQIKALISGVLIEDQIRWKVKRFSTSRLQNEKDECTDTRDMTLHTESLESTMESASLLQLVQGTCLSKVGLAITGEAFRQIVALSTSTSPNPCPLLLDSFDVDAFSSAKRVEFSAGCRFQKLKTAVFGGQRKWDSKPRTMGTLEFILRYFQIFSRMSPDDKELLVQQLQALPNHPIVGMCGDGANDCAALKAADVGISLSSKEASVAAPFNSSKEKTIRVVLDVLKEGRGALANSIQNFQFVALYAMIQLCTVTLLSHYGCSLTDSQFLYMDLGVVLPLTYFMSWSESSAVLSRVLPPQSLLAWSITVSLVGQVGIQVIFQIIALFFVLPYASSNFYAPFKVDDEDDANFFGFENTVGFLVSNIQTVIIAAVLALGTRPWKIVKRNGSFLLVSSIFMIIGFALVLNEAAYMAWLRIILDLTSLPLAFRTILLLTISLNILLSVALEEGVVRRILRRIETRQDKHTLNRESVRDFGVDEMVLDSSSRYNVPVKVED